MKKNQTFILYLMALILGFFFYFSDANAIDLRYYPNIRAYIAQVSQQHGFSQAQLTSWFNEIHFIPALIKKEKVQKFIGKPQPWYQYRDYFITPERVQAGAKFWQQNASTLAYAEKKYGVPASVIVGIIGVETDYGHNTGKYPVFNSLATFAFKTARRSHYFRNELTQYLLLCREQGWNPLAIKGSYAGAIGFPQFMPSSYRLFAVDYDRDSKRDLLHDQGDVIISVANYLSHFGWQRNQPVTVLTKIANDQQFQRIKNNHSKTKLVVKQWQHYGLKPTENIKVTLPANKINLEVPSGEQYWLTFNNFNVIKRYNNSTFYAMAVYQLGQKVKDDHHGVVAKNKMKAKVAMK